MSALSEPPRNGATWTTKELIERVNRAMDELEDHLRAVELKVAASRWVVPIVTAVLVALAVAGLTTTR